MKKQAKVLDRCLSRNLLVSYQLTNEYLIGKLFGVIRLRKILLSDILYLRLATWREASFLFLLLNWIWFTSAKRSTCPVYAIYSRQKKLLLLKLRGGAHYKLRKAIADQKKQ